MMLCSSTIWIILSLFLQTIGNGSIAQFILSKQANGTFPTVNIGYGIGLMIGAYMAGGVTGAHMNPAVTLAMALRGKTSWIKVCVTLAVRTSLVENLHQQLRFIS
jgi:glycerol uptake facilitator-like aquaporin